MISYWLMFPVVRGSLVFSGFGLKSAASGFQSYSSSSLKTTTALLRCCIALIIKLLG